MDKQIWKERLQSLKDGMFGLLDIADEEDLDDWDEDFPETAGTSLKRKSRPSGMSQEIEQKPETDDTQEIEQEESEKNRGSSGQNAEEPTTVRMRVTRDADGKTVMQRIAEPGERQRRQTVPRERAEKQAVPKERAEKRELTMEELIARNRRNRLLTKLAVVALILCVIGGFYIYNREHTFLDYVISKSIDNTMTSGTQYESVGKYLYRYNTDGVSCITRKNEVKWSVTYSMQAPIVDVCGTTMVIAEQQGTQVYVVNEKGLMGSFTCLLPILKVRVSNQGVVAVVLEDDDVTWVNLYDSSGNSLASDKTTISDSGYPLDVDLSPNGQKLVISYLGIIEGVMTSNIVFYDFGGTSDSSNDHIVASESLAGSSVPLVYFVDNTTAVAVSDDGFLVYKGSTPTKSVEYKFDEEIVSCFHDEERIGFLFSDITGENEYRMELYNYKGKQTVSTGIDVDFDEIKVLNDQILMYTSSSCSVYTMSGTLRYASAYEKEIVDIFYFSDFRRYLIITQDSFDTIRIC